MASTSDTLLDMGFTKEQVDRAIAVTGDQGVEPAMEWLLAHVDELSQGASNTSGAVLGASTSQTEANPENISGKEPGPEANSLKCNDCGKLFKSHGEVEFHAAKTGHANFSESTEEKKPLTEEEKMQQKKAIEQKLIEKRRERDEKEKNEALEREKNRIKSGKEMIHIKKRMEEEEILKALDQRRKDKEEDKLARQKIRDQIEADRQARKAKQQKSSGEVPLPAVAPLVSSTKPVAKKDYNETRLQIRLLNGQCLTQTFSVKEQLSAVRLYVEMNRTDGVEPFSLMTTFPRKVFSEEDFNTPLEALGLVPSAVIIVTKVTAP